MRLTDAKLLFFLVVLVTAALPGAAQADSEALRYLKQKGLDPAVYVVGKFRTNRVVLLGEDHAVKQNLEFVGKLIPELYKAGVYNLGMEFGASEDQAELDELVSGDIYDDEKARRLMFSYNTVWSWREYREIYRKAWEFNRTLPQRARRFRILNLSYRFDWKAFTGTRTPESMARVFNKGSIDKFRAGIIEREVLRKGEKILALVGTPHAYARYASPIFIYNNDNFCGYDSNWLGNRLLRKNPNTVFSLILHQPFYGKPDSRMPIQSPAKGEIERLVGQLNNRPLGFDLIGTPMGKLPDDSVNSTCRDNFTLGDYFDGYVFLVPLREIEAATPDLNFVDEENLSQAIEQFPDPDWKPRPRNLEELRKHIEEMAHEIERRYSVF